MCSLTDNVEGHDFRGHNSNVEYIAIYRMGKDEPITQKIRKQWYNRTPEKSLPYKMKQAWEVWFQESQQENLQVLGISGYWSKSVVIRFACFACFWYVGQNGFCMVVRKEVPLQAGEENRSKQGILILFFQKSDRGRKRQLTDIEH